MNKTELVDRLLFLGSATEMCSSTDRHNAKELAHTLIDEYLEAINYTCCCTELKADNKPITFIDWKKRHIQDWKFDGNLYLHDTEGWIEGHRLIEKYNSEVMSL